MLSDRTFGKPRVAIVGAGVCGLGVGWRLAESGCEVTIFDRGRAGQGASHAAAGMLAGGVETEPGEEALYRLNRLSQSRWPDFRHDLEKRSGVDIGYRDEGTLVLALTRDDLAQLRRNTEFQQSLGVELEWLNGADLRRREPSIRPGIAGAVFSPNDHQVENRMLSAALAKAAVTAGCRLREQTAVEEIEIAAGRVTGVKTASDRLDADFVVLASGAWSREIAGLPEECRPPVRPVKGQMLAVGMDPASHLLRHVVWSAGIYLVPRRDGRLIVGATVEERGFDDHVTAGGLFALLEAAWRTCPGIEELPVIETWVGHRPTSRDDAPILGATGVDGLVMATGHHRNGILLAPVTADEVSRHILTGETVPELEPFALDRFERGALDDQARKKSA